MNRRRTNACFLFLCVSCFCIESNSAHAQLQSSKLPSATMLDRVNLEQVWWNHAIIKKSIEDIRYFTCDEELVYVQTTGGLVSAFDTENGRMMWSLQLGRRYSPSAPVSSNKKITLIAVGLKLYAIDKKSGDMVWNIRIPEPISGSPAIDEQQIYVGTVEGTVYAIDLEKIEELHSAGKLPAWSFQAIQWRFKTGRKITRAPVSDGKTINFSDKNGSLYAANATDGSMIFQFETDDPISAPMSELGNKLYMSSEDSKLYCLDRRKGTVIWTYSAGLPIRKKALVYGDDVMLMPTRGGLRCLSASVGISKWWNPQLSDFVSASAKNFYASDRLNNLVVLARKDGSILGSIPLRNYPLRAVNEKTDRIYLATTSGLIVCLREKGVGTPYRHQAPKEETKKSKEKKKASKAKVN